MSGQSQAGGGEEVWIDLNPVPTTEPAGPGP